MWMALEHFIPGELHGGRRHVAWVGNFTLMEREVVGHLRGGRDTWFSLFSDDESSIWTQREVSPNVDFQGRHSVLLLLLPEHRKNPPLNTCVCGYVRT